MSGESGLRKTELFPCVCALYMIGGGICVYDRVRVRKLAVMQH
jgi:hypothetical protein